MIAGLHYLKQVYKLSDEVVVARWVENVYWQYFCGETYFQHEPPIHPTSMTRWRKRIGEEGCELLLMQTVEAAINSQAMKRTECERESLHELLERANRLLNQKPRDSNKLYSVHAPEVECISKGKAHKPDEFGVKVSVATTNRSGFVVGARSYPGNPYDGHTLRDQLEQVEILTDTRVRRFYVDRGYRGHGVTETAVYLSGHRRGVARGDQERTQTTQRHRGRDRTHEK